ncbi:hypothetical protein GGR57DRAFT_515627 [Xylariaceae sp. FL1272]|nr:hypothetical protein GGR57DRAFT_515627 [Xylariaceae sp. FL1272]
MADVTTIDGVWRAFAQHISIVKDGLHYLKPLITFPAGEEPLYEDMDMLGYAADTMDTLMDAMDSFDWAQDVSALTATDIDTMYAGLGHVNIVSEACEILTHEFNWLPLEHCNSSRLHGSFALDLAQPLVEQLSRLLPRLDRAMHSYRLRLRSKLDSVGVRPLTVLDLPLEILMIVFEMINDDPYNRDDHKNVSIRDLRRQNLGIARLTCRRFNSASSHLLIQSVRVDIQTQSLARLQAIAHHPLYQKSVHTIFVDTGLYYDDAYVFRDFARGCAEHLMNHVEVYPEIRGNVTMNVPASPKVRRLWEIWYQIGVGSSVQRGKDVAGLEKAYDEYRQRYRDQTQLIESGTFVNAMRTALSQMSQIRYLTVGTRGYSHRQAFDGDVLTDNAAYPLTVARLYIESLRKNPASNFKSTMDTLSNLASVELNLSGLGISLDGRTSHVQMSHFPAIENLHLRAVSERLKYIVIHFPLAVQQWLTDSQSYLPALLNIRGLIGIDLVFDENFESSSPDSFSFGPMLNGQDRSTLQLLRLENGSIHEHEFQRLIRSFTSTSPSATDNGGVMITLWGVTLLSGSWANIIDSLRVKVYPKSRISGLEGGEFDDVSEEQYEAILDDVERYCEQGWADTENPIRTALAKIDAGEF